MSHDPAAYERYAEADLVYADARLKRLKAERALRLAEKKEEQAAAADLRARFDAWMERCAALRASAARSETEESGG